MEIAFKLHWIISQRTHNQKSQTRFEWIQHPKVSQFKKIFLFYCSKQFFENKNIQQKYEVVWFVALESIEWKIALNSIHLNFEFNFVYSCKSSTFTKNSSWCCKTQRMRVFIHEFQRQCPIR